MATQTPQLLSPRMQAQEVRLRLRLRLPKGTPPSSCCPGPCKTASPCACSLERPQFSSVAQSRPTLCNPMNRNTPGLPVRHQLPESTQTHVHWVSDAIQPSHPLLSPSPALYPSQHQHLFKCQTLHPSIFCLEGKTFLCFQTNNNKKDCPLTPLQSDWWPSQVAQ